MNNPQFIAAILGFIAFAIPIVGALWKLFSVREELQTRILVGQHRLDLLDQRIEHLICQATTQVVSCTEDLRNLLLCIAKALAASKF